MFQLVAKMVDSNGEYENVYYYNSLEEAEEAAKRIRELSCNDNKVEEIQIEFV